MSRKSVKLVQSRSIYSYRKLLHGLVGDFGSEFCRTILEWCGLLPPEDELFWETYQIHHGSACAGLIGLYSLGGPADELWLGWFGILPEMRSRGLGAEALRLVKDRAAKLGCRSLKAYVDQEGRPLPFYLRNGFQRISSVRQFTAGRREQFPVWAFGDDRDHIIACDLTLEESA